MKSRLIVALVLLLLIAATVLTLNTQTEHHKPSDANKLSSLSADSVNTITIHRNNADSLFFEKQGGFWWLAGPPRFRARQERIDAILALLQSRSFSKMKPGETPLHVYKLLPAELVLELDQHRFSFGGTDPIDNRRYVLFNDLIHLVNDNLFHQLRQSKMFFLSTRLIAENEVIASIDFGENVLRGNAQNWQIEPETDTPEKSSPAMLASAWQNAIARSVSAYERSATPAMISVSLQSGRTAIFDLVSSEPNLVLGRADLGLQYNFAYGHAEKLLLLNN